METTIKSTEAKKGQGIADLLRSYSPQLPEEIRTAARDSTSIIEQTLKIFEPCLEPELDLDEVRTMAEKEAGILTPREIDLFLQASINYDENRWYGGAMGIFISVLMKKSYETGYKEFILKTRSLTSRLHNLWSEPNSPGINLTVDGPVGQYFGSFARDSYLLAKGNVDESPGGNAKNCTFEFEGEVIEFFGSGIMGEYYLNTTYIFHGEVWGFVHRGNQHLTFKTSKERTLAKLIDKVGAQPGNRLYFINPDKTEELLQDYDGKLLRK